jgi:hypothetical protein
MGSWVHQLLTTLCVALSLVLFARGGADPAGRFFHRTLSYSRPTTIMGPILDTVAISCTWVYCAGKAPPLCLLDCYTAGL